MTDRDTDRLLLEKEKAALSAIDDYIAHVTNLKARGSYLYRVACHVWFGWRARRAINAALGGECAS